MCLPTLHLTVVGTSFACGFFVFLPVVPTPVPGSEILLLINLCLLKTLVDVL